MKSTLLALETVILALLSALVLTGCASHRPLQVAEHVTRDTVYINKLQYDSIYIDNRQKVYQQSDTIYKVQHDSIPYQVTVTEVKEITRPLSLFDHLTHFTFWLVVGALLLLIIRVIIRLKKSGNIR